MACKTSAKRLFPNFAFIDAPFNLKYYKPGHPETRFPIWACRTRVFRQRLRPDEEISFGAGQPELYVRQPPRIAIRANGSSTFFEELERKLDLTCRQLLDPLRHPWRRKRCAFHLPDGQGVWLDSDKLGIDDEVGEVLRHGTLSVGFIGLAEPTLVALTGHHHGRKRRGQTLGRTSSLHAGLPGQ
jgi:ribonucleoside-triphosphate reductase